MKRKMNRWTWVGRGHCNEQIYHGEMGKKEKQSGSCPEERSRTERWMVLRNRMTWVA